MLLAKSRGVSIFLSASIAKVVNFWLAARFHPKGQRKKKP
jgi:hypothetical protein